jgi:phage-related protein
VEGIGRAFYCTLVGKRIVVLHGFVKKTDKTPSKELKIARDRLKELKP